jgi:hypothetical protein
MDLTNLCINETYILTTKQDIRQDQRIIVLGILGYEEAARRFALNNVALNYKITPDIAAQSGEDPYELYFRDKLFYHCTLIDSRGRISTNVSDPFIIWDAIINYPRTRLIKSTRTFKMVLKLNSVVNNAVINPLTQEEFLKQISELALTLGSELEFRQINDDFITPEEVFENRIQKIDETMTSIEKLTTVAPVLDRINSNEINAKIESIRNGLEVVNESLTVIKAGLKI